MAKSSVEIRLSSEASRPAVNDLVQATRWPKRSTLSSLEMRRQAENEAAGNHRSVQGARYIQDHVFFF